jgi:MFS family permease
LKVGPSTGPLVGGWIAEKSNWHWVFWSVSIADAILQIAAFVCCVRFSDSNRIHSPIANFARDIRAGTLQTKSSFCS